MLSTPSQALLPRSLEGAEFRVAKEAFALFSGVMLIAILAQLVIPLPWTPVPITGQSLAASLVALSWGRRRGLAVFALYLAVGGLGLPIFAFGKSGLAVGPTSGYLMGMMVASYVVGALADRGFTRSFGRSLAATYVGSVITLGLGALVLSRFVPASQAIALGVVPFLAGDLVKNLIAAGVSWRLRTGLSAHSS